MQGAATIQHFYCHVLCFYSPLTKTVGGCELVQEKIGSQGWGFWGEEGGDSALRKLRLLGRLYLVLGNWGCDLSLLEQCVVVPSQRNQSGKSSCEDAV